MGHADYLSLGDYNAYCSLCGRKFKASELQKHWQGQYRCKRCWEPRHSQDFVRGETEHPTPPWTQPPEDTFVTGVCTLQGRSGVAGLAVAGCSIAGYLPAGLYESISTYIV